MKSTRHYFTAGNRRRRDVDGLLNLKGKFAAHPSYTVRKYLAKCTSTY